ncbi:class I SAM-dependent methyltransferase [Donghicola mangrovi]|uniref:Methyltransferase domain-containing protein n=1 Tax=Donghicola mangrovi TaxID=2729614 RepID=A0A850Q940_9RHOB|nr:methyltransferase domain-containing protein [Donghicola mangrovi]NVO23280.1 methyltransferase domain-containing protein [Donghicola mangrovi]
MSETAHFQSNRGIRDDIRDYWSDRAAGFDLDPGHKISDGAEARAWADLLERHLGAARDRTLLDLASGTGEIAMLCHRAGYRVTGLDWSEPMLALARAKAIAAGAAIEFLQADAERIPLRSDSRDVIITRHLVWTLVDPAAAFAEWFRVLKPGGQVLIVDGDFVTKGWLARLLARLSPPKSGAMAARHTEILSQVHFSGGARAKDVATLLELAGFTDITINTDLRAIHRAQARQLGLRKSLLRRSEHRYAVSARKPA